MGKLLHRSVGWRPKCTPWNQCSQRKKRAKGISTHVVRKKISHYDNIQCLKQAKTSFCKQTQIAQEKHQLYTVQQNKVILNPFDYKRYLKEDGTNSYAYCHIKIEEDKCTEFFYVIDVCMCVWKRNSDYYRFQTRMKYEENTFYTPF